MDPSLPRLQLTDAERERFAAYLEMEAKSDFEMAAQIDKFGQTHAMMAKKCRSEAMAAQIIAMKLRSTESFST